jgi:FlaA1/EpsC-like NDP-sugar epimerase
MIRPLDPLVHGVRTDSLVTLLWQNRPLRRTLVVAVHATLWAAAFGLALSLRFEGPLRTHALLAANAAVLLICLRMICFFLAGLFDGVWRYAGFPELEKIVVATSFSSVAAFAADAALFSSHNPPALYVAEWFASIVLAGGARLAMRAIIERRHRRTAGQRMLIVGAGDAGESLVRDAQRMSRAPHWIPAGFLDDDRRKHGALIRGVRVLGAADAASIEKHVREQSVQLVVLAMPTAAGSRIREAMRVCHKLDVEVRTVPSLTERIPQDGAAPVREINIDDLLRREPVLLGAAQIEQMVRGRVVLVTGAGGSIGSDLCRQVMRFAPDRLLLVDHDENALFYVERELRERHPETQLLPLLADITDRQRIDRIFAQHKPYLVLHAAAHKHVAMMEKNACEAVKNNILGTLTLTDAATANGVSAFVLISTDKAVRPRSVMGATKRVTEMIIQRRALPSQTRMVAVRFGNVLGSAGSVVPIFLDQISRGGPVTVTDADVSRYFMTIPEASQLVLEAATLGSSGEILMLDMGEPVKIVELARDLIDLSGRRDVKITFTGLKQGEKLTEDLLLEEESYDRTQHPKIVVGRMQPIEPLVFDRAIDQLRKLALSGDDAEVRRCLSAMISDANLDPGQDELEAAPAQRTPRTG